MKKIGVTGGIGSGKSLVCSIFSQLGVPVFNADAEAKILLHSEIVKDFYRNEFGNNVFTNGALDKKKIARVIFNDTRALHQVNAFIHPMVAETFKNWSMQYNHVPYIIKEAALLFETGNYKSLDMTMLVTAPEATKIARVMGRDKLTEAEVKARIDKQMSDDEKILLADIVLKNDGENPILHEIIKLHQHITSNLY